MPTIQSKIESIEMEDTRTFNNAIELLTTKMTVREQQRQQNDCMNLINEYHIPGDVTEFGSMTHYSYLYQFTSAKLLYRQDYLNFERLSNSNVTENVSAERIGSLYDDFARCVILETKQILTYIEKQREKCEAKKKSICRSKSFNITNINEKLGCDVMQKIKSYMPIQTMVEVYSYGLRSEELYNKLIKEVITFNRVNIREIYEITVDIMGKRREQLLIALFRQCGGNGVSRPLEIRMLREKFKQIFNPVFKNGSTTPRNHGISQKSRMSSILQVAKNCVSCHYKDEFVKVNIQNMGMDFADLINHLYNYSDYKKSLYYAYPNKEGSKKRKKKTTSLNVCDYKKIKYLYEEVGESWKVIACQYEGSSYPSIKRIYDKEREKEFNEEHKKAHEEKRAVSRINGHYKNMKTNKYFHYIKYGMKNEKHIQKYLSRPMIE